MFFNISLGKPASNTFEAVAEVVDKKTKEPTGEFVYINTYDTPNRELNPEFVMTDHTKELLPVMKRQEGYANRIFMAGGTLSGKSFLSGKMARSYQKQEPKNKIVLITGLDGSDKNYKGLKKFYPLNIDEDILDDPIELEELKNSLTIFDDCHFTDKEISKEIEALQSRVIKAGRHQDIACIVCKQLLMDGHATKDILNNCFQVVAFPHSAGRGQFGAWLKRYMQLDQNLIQKILNLPSRWILVNRTAPVYVLHSNGLFLPAYYNSKREKAKKD